MKGKRQVNRGNDSKFKLTNVLSVLLVVVIASSDIVPFVNVAVDTINGVDKTGVELGLTDEDIADELLEEELTEEGLEELEPLTEEFNSEELISEEGGAELEELNSLEELNTEELTPEQPNERMRSGVSLMSLSPQSTNNYVMAKDSDFSGTSNGNFRYIGSGGYVEIPDTIKGVRVTSYANMFNNVGHGVQGVKSTNKNVTSMSGMFSNFQGSSTLDVSQLDTSAVTSMSSMFHGTTHSQTNLRTIIGLENFDTSKVTNFSNMFYRSAVSELNVHNFDTSRAVNMYRMFGDALVTGLDLSGFDTSNVTNMSGMFLSSRLPLLDISSFDTSKVTNMHEMFSRAQATTLIIGDNFKTDNVTTMRLMFIHANIRNLDFSGFNTSKVTDMGYMFSGSRFTTLDLSGFDTRNVTSMMSMFENSHATSINLRGKFDTSKVTTMNSMFNSARATSLDLRNFNTSNVTDMIFMFRDAQATSINLGSNFNTAKVDKMSRMFNGSRATSLNLSGFDTQNVTDMDRMFMDSHARELDLSSFSTSRLTSMEEMFANSQATKIDVTSFDTTFVTNMSRMFDNTKATSLDLSSFDMTSVNDTRNMFRNTEATSGQARTRLDASKFNSSSNKPTGLSFSELYVLAKDEDFSGYLNGQFRYTGSHEYVEIPRVIRGINVNSYRDMFMGTNIKGVFSTNTNVTDMGGMFRNTTSNSIDVRSINTQNVTNMSGMFEGSKVTRLDLSRFDTAKVTNMSTMFRNTVLREIDLGSFDLAKVTNTTNMFQGANATVGYARTQGEATRLNSSSNKPSGLTFTVWGITTTQSTYEWTNKPIDLTINAVSGLNGISYVEMVNETGRNYALNSRTPALFSTNNHVSTPTSMGMDNTIGARWVYGRDANSNLYRLSLYNTGTYEGGRGTRYSEDLYPVPDVLTFSLDVMSEYPIQVGFRGGTRVTLVPNQWTRITKTGSSSYTNRPEGLDVPQQANIPLGARLYYRNFKIEVGSEATPWKPAPEDSESSSEQSDTFRLYENGTYIFRATDTAGETNTVSHTVTNIDTTQPTADITKSTTGWTSQDVEIYVNAKDDLSGVDSITLPDGSVVKSDTTTFVAKSNGKYTFKITDRAGNTTTYTEDVTNIDRSIPKLTATLSTSSWTRNPVTIQVTSEQSASGLVDITEVNGALPNVSLNNNTKTYTADKNGLYTFRATYNNGATSEVSVNVTNIDTVAPKITVLNNPEDWTEDDEVVLEINATDNNQSGVKSITLPDGRVVNGNKATYRVTENGDYEFKSTDNVGNITTHTETVDRLMIPYGFYIFDNSNNAVQGARFALLRDGGVFKEATSDSSGYVDFGKVPPTWSYSIRQLSSPGGGTVLPGDIEISDPTDPVEVVTYPRGKELPSTGTKDSIVLVSLVIGTIAVIYGVDKKKQLIK